MKKIKNTLFIVSDDTMLHRRGDRVVVRKGEEEISQYPIVILDDIISFSRLGLSPSVVELLTTNNIQVSILSPWGNYLGGLTGPINGNVLLRRRQYDINADWQESLHLARLMIAGKIHNYRELLMRKNRDNGSDPDISAVVENMARLKKDVLSAESLDVLRGIEGMAANAYFGVFDRLIIQQKDVFRFSKRTRRPPEDEINALLSFAYSIVMHKSKSALLSVGLDPYVGVLHTLRPGRPALALDLMEELRSYLGDRFVLQLVNLNIINKSHFSRQDDKTVYLNEKGRALFFEHWRKDELVVITHPFLKEEISKGLLPYVQASLLAKYIRGDIDDYPVFLTK